MIMGKAVGKLTAACLGLTALFGLAIGTGLTGCEGRISSDNSSDKDLAQAIEDNMQKSVSGTNDERAMCSSLVIDARAALINNGFPYYEVTNSFNEIGSSCALEIKGETGEFSAEYRISGKVMRIFDMNYQRVHGVVEGNIVQRAGFISICESISGAENSEELGLSCEIGAASYSATIRVDGKWEHTVDGADINERGYLESPDETARAILDHVPLEKRTALSTAQISSALKGLKQQEPTL